VNRALLELLVRGLRGRVLRMARLVKQPKYLVGSVVGLLYLGWFVARPFLAGSMVTHNFTLDEVPPSFFLGLHVLAALAMALYLSVSWTLFPAGPPLRLRENELQLLLPAPISRRQLIQFALAKSLPGILIGVIVITALFSRGSLDHRLARGAGVFTLFVLWDLHGKGRNLWRMQLADLPARQALPRRLFMIAAVAVFWVIAVTGVAAVVREVAGAIPRDRMSEQAIRDIAEAVGAALRHGWLRVILAPFLLIAGPFLGRGVYPLPLSWLVLLGLVAVHYVWVVSSQTRFEDALLEKERRRAAEGPRRKGRARLRLSERQRGSAPFRLSPTGRPEVAIFWKDLLVVTRFRWSRLLSWALAGVAAAGALAAATTRYPGVIQVLGTGALIVALVIPVVTPTAWSNGFRRDLKHFELLRTWPVTPHRLVLGQILAPWVQAASLILVCLGVFLAVDVGARVASGVGLREVQGIVPDDLAAKVGIGSALFPWVVVVSAAPLLVSVAAFASSLECLAALAFPGWLISFDRHRGDPAAFGNRILVVVGFGILMMFAVVPVAMTLGIVVLIHAGLHLPFLAWELPFLGLLAASPIVLETYLVIRGAGKLWVNIDPSQELLEGFS